MRNRALGSLVGVAVLGIAATAPAQTIAPDVSTAANTPPFGPSTSTPVWVRQPNGEDKEDVYPIAARIAGIGGEVVISCEVVVSGAMANCKVMSESPSGQGFGDAALKLAPRFRIKPLTLEGGPVEGGIMRLTILFTPPDDW